MRCRAGSGRRRNSFGLSYVQTMRYVVLPQAIRTAIPPTMNLAIGQLQTSSLISIIGVADLTRVGTQLYVRTLKPFLVWPIIGIIYFVIAKILSHHRRPHRGAAAGAPGSPGSRPPYDRDHRRLQALRDHEVLKDITMGFNDGEVTAILGPSGARQVDADPLHQLPRDDLEGRHRRRRQIGDATRRRIAEIQKQTSMVFQHFNLYPHLNALQNIMLAPMHVLKLARGRSRGAGASSS